MPRAPKKCGRTDCEERVVGRKYCVPHTQESQERANTTQRGYGSDHQAARQRALANFVPGQPCVRCNEPLLNPLNVVLDHNDDRTGYLGLAHKRCNDRAGGQAKAHRGTHPSPPVGRLTEPYC
jgi:hypothetical protein